MHEMTAANLRSAFGGESMAHMRYHIWGEKAEKDGFPNVGRLFQAIADAERVHAANHFVELRDQGGDFLVPAMAGFGLSTTSENLAGAIAGENFETEEMYPAFIEVAKAQQERGAQRSFHFAVSAEAIHAAMFQKAKQAVDDGKDAELGSVQVCAVCGYTVEGEIPDRCPICGAKKDEFRTFA
jgi:rubrerythrin